MAGGRASQDAGRTAEQASRERRALERDAIVGLALASLPDEHEVRALIRQGHDVALPELPEALATLASLTAERQRRSQRTLSLNLVAKVARRRGFGVLADAGESLDAYLAALLDEADELRSVPGGPELNPEQDPEHVADGALSDVLGALRVVADSAGEVPVPSHWATFCAGAAEPLGLRSGEINLPTCSDDEYIPVNGKAAPRVTVTFWDERPADAFARWTDPRCWDLDCSLFFESVTADPPVPMDVEEYEATFTEVVRIDEHKVLTTPLVFTREVSPPNFFGVYFDLPTGVTTEDLTVDRGFITARHDPDLPEGPRTLLTAEKCICFADPALAAWPTLLCDLFWMELTITVALGCAQSAPAPDEEKTPHA